MVTITNTKISICLKVNQNKVFTKNFLVHLLDNYFEGMELICITDKKTFSSINIFLKNHNMPTYFKKDTSNILDYVNGDYFLFLDSSDWISGDIEKICKVMDDEKLDIFLNDQIFTQNYFNEKEYCSITDLLNQERISHGMYANILFNQPKYSQNIYKTNFLRKNAADIPNYILQHLDFYFKTMFSTIKVGYGKNSFLQKRFKKDYSLEERILLNFNLNENDNVNDELLQVDLFFNEISKIIDFFIERDIYNEYKYNLLNYLFDLFRNIFEMDIYNNQYYYQKLKVILTNNFSSLHADLVLNLKEENLQFYRNVLNSSVLSELQLLYNYQKLIMENEIIAYQKEKLEYLIEHFLTLRFDIKNMGNFNNSVEIMECDDDSASIYYPNWLNDNRGVGAIVQSMNGNIHFKLRCHRDGILKFNIRGIDLKDKNGNRLPAYVDLLDFSINDEKILRKNILIHHDEPYSYELEVKNNEIIDIRANWKSMSKISDYNKKNRKINNINHFMTGRVDVKNFGGFENSVKVFDISDDDARVVSPGWMRDGSGVGTMIQSVSGDLGFKVKCHHDGVLRIALRGMDFKDKNGVRLPVYIDFTKLIVNGDKVLENTLIHHDKPFVYELNVKDGEIVDLKVTWRPMNHYSHYKPVHRQRYKVNHFMTGRVDVKNFGGFENSVKVFDISDDDARVVSPGWMRDGSGVGTMIQSVSGDLGFKVKCHHDGVLKIALRGMDFKDKNGVRLPVYVDFTSLKVNNKEILENNILTHHDKPFVHKFNVEHNEIIKVNVKWKPMDHNSEFKNP